MYDTKPRSYEIKDLNKVIKKLHTENMYCIHATGKELIFLYA